MISIQDCSGITSSDAPSAVAAKEEGQGCCMSQPTASETAANANAFSDISNPKFQAQQPVVPDRVTDDDSEPTPPPDGFLEEAEPEYDGPDPSLVQQEALAICQARELGKACARLSGRKLAYAADKAAERLARRAARHGGSFPGPEPLAPLEVAALQMALRAFASITSYPHTGQPSQEGVAVVERLAQQAFAGMDLSGGDPGGGGGAAGEPSPWSEVALGAGGEEGLTVELLVRAGRDRVEALNAALACVLRRTLSPRNCFAALLLGRCVGCSELEEAGLLACVANFPAALRADKAHFLLLDEAAVLALTSNSHLQVSHELEVWQAISEWVQHSWPSRVHALHDLLRGGVRLSRMDTLQLSQLQRHPLLAEHGPAAALVGAAYSARILSNVHQSQNRQRAGAAAAAGGGGDGGGNGGNGSTVATAGDGGGVGGGLGQHLRGFLSGAREAQQLYPQHGGLQGQQQGQGHQQQQQRPQPHAALQQLIGSLQARAAAAKARQQQQQLQLQQQASQQQHQHPALLEARSQAHPRHPQPQPKSEPDQATGSTGPDDRKPSGCPVQPPAAPSPGGPSLAAPVSPLRVPTSSPAAAAAARAPSPPPAAAVSPGAAGARPVLPGSGAASPGHVGPGPGGAGAGAEPSLPPHGSSSGPEEGGAAGGGGPGGSGGGGGSQKQLASMLAQAIVKAAAKQGLSRIHVGEGGQVTPGAVQAALSAAQKQMQSIPQLQEMLREAKAQMARAQQQQQQQGQAPQGQVSHGEAPPQDERGQGSQPTAPQPGPPSQPQLPQPPPEALRQQGQQEISGSQDAGGGGQAASTPNPRPAASCSATPHRTSASPLSSPGPVSPGLSAQLLSMQPPGQSGAASQGPGQEGGRSPQVLALAPQQLLQIAAAVQKAAASGHPQPPHVRQQLQQLQAFISRQLAASPAGSPQQPLLLALQNMLAGVGQPQPPQEGQQGTAGPQQPQQQQQQQQQPQQQQQQQERQQSEVAVQGHDHGQPDRGQRGPVGPGDGGEGAERTDVGRERGAAQEDGGGGPREGQGGDGGGGGVDGGCGGDGKALHSPNRDDADEPGLKRQRME